MKEKDNFLRRYLNQAPVFLAMVRGIECRMISKLNLKRPILDLGCGDGLFSSILFSEPPEAGIDISLDEIRLCLKKKACKNVAVGDLASLPVKTGSFNTIICNSVMEHVVDLKSAITEACRVLSHGGKFILTLPTENYEKFLFYPRIFEGLGFKNLARSYRTAINKIFRHYHALPATQWLKLIKDNGFEVIRTIHYLPGKAMALNDFYLPFSAISLLNKKIFKRWIFNPVLRKYLVVLLELHLRKVYLCNGSREGSCLLIEATRL